ncbi:MAG: response regulator transcription factor [Sedimentisphaerales bacterium]|nr:response regulator transcription factor [Sedimentisphaerales bacterium]
MAQKKQPDNSNEKKADILIVDDHPIVRQGLTELINHEKDLTVCGQAEDANQAMKAVKELTPDLAIVDISLKETSGMELIKDLNTQYPNLPVLALSMHDESLYAERVLRAGARGYLMKAEATEKVIIAIRKILRGEICISDKMASKMMRKLVGGNTEINASPVELLSDRELEVFQLIGKGFGTRQIAQKLYLSIKTIETYRAHIKEKLNLANSAELLQYAIRWVNSRNDM